MASKAKTRYSAPALEKGLDILEYLSRTSTPQTQANLMRALGRTQGEIYRMLECLVHRGYVQREENTGSYRLTLKLYALGHRHNRMSTLRRAAAVPMEEFAEATGQSCHLSLLHGHEALIVMERLPARRVCLAVGEGTLLSLSQSASGTMLVSKQPTPEARRQLLRLSPEFRRRKAKAQEALVNELGRQADQPWVLTPSRVTPGGIDIVTVVGIAETDAFAALATSYVEAQPDETLRLERAQALVDCAQDINHALGL